MALYMGQYTHNLDQKNRLAIPAKFRDSLGESFVLYKSQNGDRCLSAYALDDWAEMIERMEAQGLPLEQLKWQRRLIGANTVYVDVDKQGRITIPPEYTEFAGFQREIVILGAVHHLELWDSEAYNTMMQSGLQDEAGMQFELTM